MKMIKLSLVAAVAVAGLTTTSSAAKLSDTVKNTELTGYVRYRLNTNHDTANKSNANEESKAVMKFTTKVNDSVKANIKFVSFADTSKHAAPVSTVTDDNSSDTTPSTVATTDGATHTNANTAIYEANFVASLGKATVIAGLQTTQSPFAANNGDTRSHGVTALIPVGPVTIAAAHYTTTVAGATVLTDNLTAIGAIAKVGNVNVEAWTASFEGKENATGDEATAILASTKIGNVAVSAHHASKDAGVTTSTNDDVENTQIVASTKLGKASVVAAYATTGKDGGDVTFDTDIDSKLIFALETISTKTADVDAVVLGASAPVGPVTMGITYLDADIGTAGSGDETKVSVAYAMSKNFNVSAWYSDATVNKTGSAATDYEKSRIEVKYTF